MISANALANQRSAPKDQVKSAEEEIWKFLTRAEKMNRTNFPDCTQTKFIIRGKSDGYGFIEKMSKYDTDHMQVPEEEIKATIKDLNVIANKVYCMKRKNDEYDFLQSHVGLLYLIFVLTVVGFIVLAVSDYYRENEALFYAGIIIMAIAGVLVVVVASLLTFKEKKHIGLMKELQSQMQSYIDKKNHALKKYQGARLTLEKELRWIELELSSS